MTLTPALELALVLFGSWWSIHILVAVGVLAAAVWGLLARQRRQLWIDYKVAWWLWHWFTGGPLDSRRTDRGCGNDPFCRFRRGALAAGRATVVAALMLVEYMRSGSPNGTGPLAVFAWAYGGAVAAAVAAIALAHASVKFAIWFWWVRPAYKAMRKLCDWPEKTPRRLGRYIKIPRVPGCYGLGARISLAPTCPLDEKRLEAIEDHARKKLGLGAIDTSDLAAVRDLEGRRHNISFVPVSRVPETVDFADADTRANVRALAGRYEVWLGQGRDGVHVTRDLSKHPHMLISAPTGGGKSTLAKAIIAQLGHKNPDAEIFNLDGKHHSYVFLRGVAGVRHIYTAEDMHDTLVALGVEARRRNEAADDLTLHTYQGYVDSLTPKFIVAEELNGTMAWLEQWWQGHRRKGIDPVKSPAVVALREILFMARAVGFFVIGLAQQGSAQAMGGGAARENYVTRILGAGYTRNTAKMLCPELDLPPALDRDGWAMVCHGRTVTEMQGLLIGDFDAFDYITETRGTVPWSGAAPVERLALPAAPAARPEPVALRVAGELPAAPPADDNRELTLRQLVDQRLVAAETLRALREQRDKWTAPDVDAQFRFPNPTNGPARRGVETRYLVSAVQHWDEIRPRGRSDKKRAHEPLDYFIVSGGIRRVRYGQDIKIGWSENLKGRCKQLACKYPDDVLFTVRDDEDRTQETAFHEQWEADGHRVHDDREMFVLEGTLAVYVADRLRQRAVQRRGQTQTEPDPRRARWLADQADLEDAAADRLQRAPVEVPA